MISLEKNLAINGGDKTRVTPFPGWPYYDDDEINAVTAVLKSGKVNYWTGEEIGLFETEYCSYLGMKYAVAMANATVALESALHALEIGDGDEVIVTPRTFIASVSSIVLSGAIPVFVDIDPVTQNITTETIEQAINSKTRAIMLVHLAGWPCEMDKIMELAEKNNLYVIEDCAQAHGAEYKDQQVGTFGDVAVFSFCQDKIISTGGEGGMLITNNHAILEKAWAYKDHGKNNNKIQESSHSSFSWVHDTFGKNFRMTEMQAAIGRLQLKKLEEWISVRRRNAGILNDALSDDILFRTTIPENSVKHAYYKYYCFINPECLSGDWSRDKIIQAVNAEGIPCFSGSCPEIYKEKAFSNFKNVNYKNLPNAELLGDTSLMLSVHPTLNSSDISDMAEGMKKVSAVVTGT